MLLPVEQAARNASFGQLLLNLFDLSDSSEHLFHAVSDLSLAVHRFGLLAGLAGLEQ